MSKQLVIILLGATGDLSRLKLLPAIRELWIEGQIAPNTKLIAVGRSNHDWESYTETLKKAPTHPFSHDLSTLYPEYIQVDFDEPGGFNPLLSRMKEMEEARFLIYFALAPDITEKVLERISEQGAIELDSGTDISVIIEKPVGESLKDSERLNDTLVRIFGEPHIYRNDHYLNKDSVESLISIRNYDKLLKSYLDKESLLEAQIIVSEQVDLGTRVSYFDCRGILIDWVQSHLLQILATTFADINTDNFAMSKAEFINSLEPIPKSIIKAVYEGYKDTQGVDPKCETETFFAIQLKSDIPKWEGVNFGLVAGKAMAEKSVCIKLKLRAEDPKFGREIVLHLDPPRGNPLVTENTGKEFEKTIQNAIRGNHKKFVSQAEVRAQWEVTEKMMELRAKAEMRRYEKGTSYEMFCNSEWC